MSNFLSPMKLDFSSFYKFVSSVGLLLIVASASLPWFALNIAAPNTEKGTPAASTVEAAIDARANQYLFIVKAYPWLSLVLFALGCAITTYGLLAWRKRQKLQDEDENETFRQRKELGQTVPATEKEREEKLNEEATDYSTNNDKEPSLQTTVDNETLNRKSEVRENHAPNTATQYKKRFELIRYAESQVAQLVEEAFSSTHAVETGVRVSGPTSEILDLVGRAKDPDRWTSFAVETRVITRSPSSLQRIRDALVSIAVGAREVPEGQVQVERRGRPPFAKSVSICLIVISDESTRLNQQRLNPNSTRRLRRNAAETVMSINSVLLRKAGAVAISQDDLDSLPVEWLRNSIIEAMLNPDQMIFSEAANKSLTHPTDY